MRNGTGVSADVAVGVAGVVIDVLCLFKLLLQTSNTRVPVVGFVVRPCIDRGVRDMSRRGGDHVSADITGLRRGLGCRRAGGVSCLVLLRAADRANVPMLVFILCPLIGVAVRDRTGVSAGVAGGVAGMVIVVISLLLLGTANRALIPMLVGVLGQRFFILVRNGSGIATDVAFGVAIVGVDVCRNIHFVAAIGADVPVVGSVGAIG